MLVYQPVTQPPTLNCAPLLLISDNLNVTVEAFEDVASKVIFFQQPVLKEVKSRVDAMAKRISGPHTQHKRTIVESWRHVAFLLPPETMFLHMVQCGCNQCTNHHFVEQGAKDDRESHFQQQCLS